MQAALVKMHILQTNRATGSCATSPPGYNSPAVADTMWPLSEAGTAVPAASGRDKEMSPVLPLPNTELQKLLLLFTSPLLDS